MHVISPIFKSGDRSSVRNYRPISLLCTVSKVLERIVHEKIIDFLSPTISSHQFGFLRKRSVLQQLLVFLHNILSSLSTNSQVDVIYLDISKAFDSIPHDKLLLKLWSVGICGNLWFWFKGYLSSRRQCVSVRGQRSDFLPVLSGVPQGSILGPLLFLIYINDLPTFTSFSFPLLFADDTKCLKHIISISDCHLLQKDLLSLNDWSSTTSLSFNSIKCTLLRFCTKSPLFDYNYSINNNAIVVKKCHRDLGVLMSNTLNWSAHYDAVSSKAYKMLGLLHCSFWRSCCMRAQKTFLHDLC